ncbi:hypothetical protein Pst134EA_033533 [Puccinia striiformis f. sp. tritici]|uniref:hypothetical protein n=1 Tax=Puccinia striiformis f. sp. tritici TaxID=168172 RepID=UPI00200865C6|nr:hypothetical protein Pst134EA_033533 [Puccinia striiformis f. sp. tritici]KAH9461383.1 hypothetical protein Pst134EA_033533 [Puccinia striiformis f. sp. tritici]
MFLAKILSRSSQDFNVNFMGMRIIRISGRVNSPSIIVMSDGCKRRFEIIEETAIGRQVAESMRTGMLFVAINLVAMLPYAMRKGPRSSCRVKVAIPLAALDVTSPHR